MAAQLETNKIQKLIRIDDFSTVFILILTRRRPTTIVTNYIWAFDKRATETLRHKVKGRSNKTGGNIRAFENTFRAIFCNITANGVRISLDIISLIKTITVEPIFQKRQNISLTKSEENGVVVRATRPRAIFRSDKIAKNSGLTISAKIRSTKSLDSILNMLLTNGIISRAGLLVIHSRNRLVTISKSHENANIPNRPKLLGKTDAPIVLVTLTALHTLATRNLNRSKAIDKSVNITIANSDRRSAHINQN